MRAARLIRSDTAAAWHSGPRPSSAGGGPIKSGLNGTEVGDAGTGIRSATPSTTLDDTDWPRGFANSRDSATPAGMELVSDSPQTRLLPGSAMNVEQVDLVAAALEAAPLFHGCRAGSLQHIAKRAKCFKLRQGEELMLGDNEPMMVVLSGEVSARVGSGNEAALGPGSFLNACGMLGYLYAAEPFKPRCISGNPMQESALKSLTKVSSKQKLKPLDSGEKPAHADATGRSAAGSGTSAEQTFAMEVSRCISNLCPHASSQLTPETCGRKSAGWLRLNCIAGTTPSSLSSGSTIPPSLPPSPKGTAGFGRAVSRSASPSRRGTKCMMFDQEPRVPQDVEVALIDQSIVAEVMSSDPGCETQFMENRDSLLNMWRIVLRNFVFPGAPLEVAWAIAEVSKKLVFNEGDLICEENDLGDAAESLFVIASGEATVEKLVWRKGKASTHVAGNLGPGAIIGDFCFIGTHVPCVATVRADTELVALQIPDSGMRSVLARYPGITLCFRHSLRETVMSLQPSLPPRNEAFTLKLFSECRVDLIHDLAKAAERRVCHCGEIIKRQDCDDGSLAIIEFGVCGYYVDGNLVQEGEIGTCMGERSLLGLPPSRNSNATVRVLTPLSLLLTLSRTDFRVVVGGYPDEEVEKMHIAVADGNPKGGEIAKMEVLRKCGKQFVDSIIHSIEMRCYMPGQTVTVEGNVDTGSMYVIKGGRVYVQIQGKAVAQLHAGAAFGELAMLGVVRRRTATILAASHVFTYEIPRANFLAALDRHPEEKEHFERMTMRYSNVASKSMWPIFQEAPKHLLYLVNFYTDRSICTPGAWESQRGDKLPTESVIQVLQGTIKIYDADGKEVHELTDGCCFNEQILLDLPPTSNVSFVPKTICEIQIMTKKVFQTIMSECPQSQELVRRQILQEMARKAEKGKGLDPNGIGILQQSALFRASPQGLAHAVRKHLVTLLVQPGDQLFEQDEPGNSMYFVVDGKTCMGEGESEGSSVYGEACMLGIAKFYPYTVYAKTRCLVQMLGGNHFKACLKEYPESAKLFHDIGANIDSSKSVARRLSMRSNSLFSNAGFQFASTASRWSDDVFYAPGEEIITRGYPCALGKSEIFVLNSGDVDIEVAFDFVVAKLSSGAMVGEGGGLGISMLRNAAVRAVGPGINHCTRLNGMALKEAIEGFPNTYELLVQVFEARQAENAEKAALRREWIEEKVIPALLHNYIFDEWPHELLFDLAMPLHAAEHQEGSVIFEAGDPADSMLLILEGKATVESKFGDVLFRLCSGGMIGELAMLGLLPTRTATVRATTHCKVLQVPASGFRKALTKPNASKLKAIFESMLNERCQQVADGTPLCNLNLGCGSQDVCVRAVALHAHRLTLAYGQRWTHVPDNHPCGAHVGILSKGRTHLVLGNDPRGVVAFKPGELVPEGVASEFGASSIATVPSEVYRIRMVDFHLSVHAVPNSKRWFTLFQELDSESRKRVRQRLQGARGALNCKRKQIETGCRNINQVGNKGLIPRLQSCVPHYV